MHDLSGPDATEVVADLAAVAGGQAPDATPGTVHVEGTAGDDIATVTGSGAARRSTA